ncbi:MAG: hypothetical protein KGZ96_13460 [Clostridia bacterium]|jgi:hypothetical protein|nr:hypothetical protein [Clostridia bacterium]
MGVNISPELEKVPYWPEIRDYVNERMAAEGREDSIFVRPATCEEEIQLRASGSSMFAAWHEGETLEIVIISGEYMDYEEVIKLDRKFGAAAEKNILMHLWVAQMVWMGKSLGGCDS